ncbi:M24 family metallopeptidase [Virgibacillus sp. W0181]|uniref:M24 family metallopeptidase n=1 Tax=Virgibacillus sp. W0181 TaxID=3391581 RepID=UPI003F4899B4
MQKRFSLKEYKQRLKKVKTKMEDEGIDALFVSNPSSMNYLSGYDAYSFYVPQGLIVIKEQNEPHWIGRKHDANGAKLTTWIDNDNIHYYTDDYLHARDKHPMEIVANLFKKMNKHRCRVGVEMDQHYFSAKDYVTLKNELPDVEFYDATTMVSNVRMIKSNQELQYMKNAARNAEYAMQTAVNSIQKGVAENQVAADIYHAQIKGGEGIDGDYPAIVPLLLSGVKTSSPHLTWGGEVFQGNEFITLELAGVHKRYHSPLARSIKLGQPTAEEQRLETAAREGLNQALDFVQPGKTCGEVAQVWVDEVKKHGFEKDDRLGYSVGLSYPPNWGEETASIRLGDETVLQPNMTFHLISGLWEKNNGAECSETFVVTKNGCEALANFPRELIVKQENKNNIYHGY